MVYFKNYLFWLLCSIVFVAYIFQEFGWFFNQKEDTHNAVKRGHGEGIHENYGQHDKTDEKTLEP